MLLMISERQRLDYQQLVSVRTSTCFTPNARQKPRCDRAGHFLKSLKLNQMEFTNFEEFLGIRLDSSILEQWADDLALNELLEEINEEEEEEDEE